MCEFKHWTSIQGTELRLASFHAETFEMSHLPEIRQATKCELPIVVVFGSKTPKSELCSSENVYMNCLSNFIYSYVSIAVWFFKRILYKLYIPITTVFK